MSVSKLIFNLIIVCFNIEYKYKQKNKIKKQK